MQEESCADLGSLCQRPAEGWAWKSVFTQLSEHVGGRDSFPQTLKRGLGVLGLAGSHRVVLPPSHPEEGGLSVWICVPGMSLLGQPPAPPRTSPHGPTSCRDSWGSLWGRWGVPCRHPSTPSSPWSPHPALQLPALGSGRGQAREIRKHHGRTPAPQTPASATASPEVGIRSYPSIL